MTFSCALFSRCALLVACAVTCLYFTRTTWAAAQQGVPADSPGATAAGLFFSAEQVVHGAQIYATACAICHGSEREGGHDVPDLGEYFVARWANTPLDQLAGYISRAMPLMAPGTLSPQDTTALVAFLLHQNGVSSLRNVPLPADERQLGKLRFPAAGISGLSQRGLQGRKNFKQAQNRSVSVQ